MNRFAEFVPELAAAGAVLLSILLGLAARRLLSSQLVKHEVIPFPIRAINLEQERVPASPG